MMVCIIPADNTFYIEAVTLVAGANTGEIVVMEGLAFT